MYPRVLFFFLTFRGGYYSREGTIQGRVLLLISKIRPPKLLKNHQIYSILLVKCYFSSKCGYNSRAGIILTWEYEVRVLLKVLRYMIIAPLLISSTVYNDKWSSWTHSLNKLFLPNECLTTIDKQVQDETTSKLFTTGFYRWSHVLNISKYASLTELTATFSRGFTIKASSLYSTPMLRRFWKKD